MARWIAEADGVACSEIGFVEVYRALMLAGVSDADAVRDAFERDWDAITVIQVEAALVRRAALLAVSLQLRSLDALHLAAAERVQGSDMRLMTWDRRLWRAARFIGIDVLPEVEP